MARPVHFEIYGSDPEALADFYGSLFGWTAQRWGDESYWLIGTGDGPGIDGAIVRRRGSAPVEGAPVMGATIVMGVEDIDASLARAHELGARGANAKMAVPGVGWAAHLRDPDGNVFGLFQDDSEAE